jgi:putative salt-induced outer membrane protein YdiY
MKIANMCIIKYAAGLACLLALCTSVKAQVNIETKRRLDSKSGWYNDIGLSLKYQSGNTDLLKLETSLRSDYLVGKYHTFGILTFQQEKQGGKVYTDKGFVHLRGARTISAHLGIELFLQKQYNESILLQDRNLAGGGMRISFLKQRTNTKNNTGLNLYLGIGSMWENETINDKGHGEIETNIIRSTNYVSATWRIDKRFTLILTGYYQPYLQRFADFRVLSESRLDFRATERVSFNIRLNLRYDSEPPTSVEAHDLEIVNGLSYKF